MTPLDIAAYMVLENSVTYDLPGSCAAAARVSERLYRDVPRTIFWAIAL